MEELEQFLMKELKSLLSKTDKIFCGNNTINVFTFEEKLSKEKLHKTVYLKTDSQKDYLAA